MKKTVRRALAATTAGAAGLAGALAFQVPTASAAEVQPEGARKVAHGMGAWSYGTKFVVDGIELRNLRTAFAEMPCTMYANNAPVQAGAVSEIVPEALTNIVKVDAVDTVNRTYETDTRIGSLATSTLGKIEVGGGSSPLDGLPLPKIVIDGITSTADAHWVKADKAYGTDENVSVGTIRIEIDRSTIPEELKPVLEPVLDLIDEVQAGTEEVQAVITEIIEVTGELGELAIPGLGAISINKQRSNNYGTGAVSESYAIGIRLDDLDGEGTDFAPTEIRLGRAMARIGGPVSGGVFRSFGRAFSGSILESVVPLEGGLLQLDSPTVSLPCEGTAGQPVASKTFSTGAIVGGLLVKLEDVKFEMSGKQFATGFINREGRTTNRGWAKGSMATSVGKVSVPLLGLELDDVLSSVGISNRKAGPVKRDIVTQLGSILVDGQPMAKPTKEGQTVEAETSAGLVSITNAARDLRLSHGARIAPVKVSLLPDGATDLVTFLVGESMVFLRKNA